jgi:hypothetical protein
MYRRAGRGIVLDEGHEALGSPNPQDRQRRKLHEG